MIEAVIMGCIYLVLFAIAVYIVLWVLGELGITIPPQIMKLLWVIVILVVLLFIVRMFLPSIGVRLPHGMLKSTVVIQLAVAPTGAELTMKNVS